MTEEQLFNFLKENLKIGVQQYGPHNDSMDVKIFLLLGDKLISNCEFYIPLPHKS